MPPPLLLHFLNLLLLPLLHLPPTTASPTCPTLLNPPTPRIVNGDPATPSLLPHLIALGNPTPQTPIFTLICTGVLLTPTHILTAAHCLTSHGPTHALLSTFSTSNPSHPPIPLISRLRHPNYSPDDPGYKFDLAVLQLSISANRTYATPISVNVSPDHPRSNSIVRAVGYGLTIPGDRPRDDQLRMVDMPATPDALCEQSWASTIQPADKKYHICAGYYDTRRCSPCNGDSGGPLLQYGKNGSAIVVGVVSYGTEECGSRGFPTVFVRSSAFRGWIDGVVGGGVRWRGDVETVFVEGVSGEGSGGEGGGWGLGRILAVVGGVVGVVGAAGVFWVVMREGRKKVGSGGGAAVEEEGVVVAGVEAPVGQGGRS